MRGVLGTCTLINLPGNETKSDPTVLSLLMPFDG